MITGFAFYGITVLDAKTSLSAASALFDILHVRGVEASYYTRTRPDRQGETLHLVDVPWNDLAANSPSGDIRFRATSEADHIEMLGGFDNGTNVGFSLVDLSVKAEQKISEKFILEISRVISRHLRPAYGFCFFCDSAEQSMSYANVNGAVLFAANENPFAFTDDLSEWSGGADSYKRTRLRMIYPYNILNTDHLMIKIDGMNLKDWISHDEGRGEIIELDGSHHCWIVPASRLDEMNHVLGKAGLLISWRPKQASKGRKLP